MKQKYSAIEVKHTSTWPLRTTIEKSTSKAGERPGGAVKSKTKKITSEFQEHR